MPASRRLFWRLVALCAGIRVVLEGIGLASLAAHGHAPWSGAIDLWQRWDANHYLRLAEVGYRRGVPPPDDPLFIVFFPFFPLAVRVVSFVVRDLVVSGLAVSFAASVGAGWFLHRLVAIDGDERTAWRSVVLLYSFPTAYFLAAPYSEALFVFAVVASMYAARTQRWARAGLLGALATGTRVTGVALGPALFAEAWSHREPLRRYAWIAIAGAGLVIYLLINQVVHGDPFWFLRIQRQHWFQRPVPPWQSVVDGVRSLVQSGNSSTRVFIFAGRTAAAVFTVPLLVIAARRLRLSDSVYAWSSFILMLSTAWLISLPRYLIVVYPLFIVGAQLTRSMRVYVPAVTVGAVLQGLLFWRYAVGEWTF